MKLLDYSLFARSVYLPHQLQSIPADVFISSYNSSDRVIKVFNGISAAKKFWIVHQEYGFSDEDLPLEGCIRPSGVGDEVDFWLDVFAEIGLDALPKTARLVIDITGMMRPHLMVLPKMLQAQGFSTFIMLYADPAGYAAGAGTIFSRSEVEVVRQVRGYEGSHLVASENDVLIIGGGYDAKLVHRVADSKQDARHYLMLGLPGLEAHMYQESRFRLARVLESLRRFGSSSWLFAPANDPFMTAQTLQDALLAPEAFRSDANVYLSPVGAKTQALGFALFALLEGENLPLSIIFPYTPEYSEKTSFGLTRVHAFEIELDWPDLKNAT